MEKQKRPHRDSSESSYSEASNNDEEATTHGKAKKRATVYDAVAGRVSNHGFFENVKEKMGHTQRLRPDEILFQQKNAPPRYAEDDDYFANEKLPPGHELPSGELLSTLHAYVSKLYSRKAVPEHVWRCMDETALIAFGILMEETAREKLGENGDLEFTEETEDDDKMDVAQTEEEHSGEEEAVEDDGNTEGQANLHAKDARMKSWSSSNDESLYGPGESE